MQVRLWPRSASQGVSATFQEVRIGAARCRHGDGHSRGLASDFATCPLFLYSRCVGGQGPKGGVHEGWARRFPELPPMGWHPPTLARPQLRWLAADDLCAWCGVQEAKGNDPWETFGSHTPDVSGVGWWPPRRGGWLGWFRGGAPFHPPPGDASAMAAASFKPSVWFKPPPMHLRTSPRHVHPGRPPPAPTRPHPTPRLRRASM